MMTSENDRGRDRLTRGTHRYRPYVRRGPPELDNREVRNCLLIAAWMSMVRALSRIHEAQHDADVEMEDA